MLQAGSPCGRFPLAILGMAILQFWSLWRDESLRMSTFGVGSWLTIPSVNPSLNNTSVALDAGTTEELERWALFDKHLLLGASSSKDLNTKPSSPDPLDTGYERLECIDHRQNSSTNNNDDSSPLLLPTGIIAGTMKAGTQSLMKFLLQHPDVQSSQPSELHILSNSRHFRSNNGNHDHDNNREQVDVARIQAKYHAMFANSMPSSSSSGTGATGTSTPLVLLDKSPEYLLESHIVPQRLICVFGNATKVIVVLRNPVERTVSHYHHKRRSFQQSSSPPNNNKSFPSLEEMIQSQIDVLEPRGVLLSKDDTTTAMSPRDEYDVWSRFHQDNQDLGGARADTDYGILARSLYHIQIRQWLAVFRDVFGPDDMWNHLLLVESEALQGGASSSTTKEESYKKILKFLGLSPEPLVDSHDKHQGNYSPISNETHTWLTKLFAGPNRELRELLAPYGIELSWTSTSYNS
jgi:hypothetical protein